MVHAIIDVTKEKNLFGREYDVQTGDGHDFPIFRGVRFQRGVGKMKKMATGRQLQWGQGRMYNFQSQYGRGRIISTMKRIWRYLKPLARKHLLPIAQKAAEYLAPVAKEAAKAVANEGLQAGQNVLSEIAKGTDIKDAVITEATKSSKNLMRKAGAKLQEQAGGGKAPKSLIGKKRKTDARSVRNLKLVGRSVLASSIQNANQGRHNLGFY
jgi:hypothetical protein